MVATQRRTARTTHPAQYVDADQTAGYKGVSADAADDPAPVDYSGALFRSPSGVVILEGSAAPVDGVSGTGAGFAAGGSLYIRTAGGSIAWSINTGTAASPAWKAVTHA